MRNAIMAFVLAAGTIGTVSVAAASDAWLVIRTYDMTTASPSDRAAAVATATAILEGAGLNIVWAACETARASNDGHPCMTRPRPNELSVRFVHSEASGRGHIALGYSFVDTEGHTGSLATIYVDRVRAIAGIAAMDEATVLGRAIAHEVGHLLLGTTTHSAGVMRAVWSPQMLRNDAPGEWWFTEQDAHALRRGFEMRTN